MEGYGFANLEHEVPVTPDTVFELASVTKQFTASGIMDALSRMARLSWTRRSFAISPTRQRTMETGSLCGIC